MAPRRLTAEDRPVLIPYFSLFFEVIRLSKIINRCNIEQQVKSQFRIIVQNSTDLQNVFTSDVDSVVASETPMLEDAIPQKIPDTAHER